VYARGFVVGVLAGFEDTLDALMDGVDEKSRSELAELSETIKTARLQLDPEAKIEADRATANDEASEERRNDSRSTTFVVGGPSD
jgi:hypothetical protein